MRSNVVSFIIGKKYNRLLEEEIKEGNFGTKSDFFRQLVRDWFKTNRPEKVEN